MNRRRRGRSGTSGFGKAWVIFGGESNSLLRALKVVILASLSPPTSVNSMVYLSHRMVTEREYNSGSASRVLA